MVKMDRAVWVVWLVKVVSMVKVDTGQRGQDGQGLTFKSHSFYPNLMWQSLSDQLTD